MPARTVLAPVLASLLAPLPAPVVPLVVAAPTSPPRACDDPEALARALDAVRLDALRSDLRFLADDAMGGRDTPSEGLDVAAQFLAARLARLGFASAGSGDYFHTWLLRESGVDPETSYFEFSGELDDGLPVRLAPGEDYFFNRMGLAYEVDATGTIVSVGTGSRDEFAAAEPSGAWALVFDEGASYRRTLRYAEKAGAIGVLFAETARTPDPFAEKYGRTTEIVLERRSGYSPAPTGDDERDLPSISLSADAARRMFERSPVRWDGAVAPAGTRMMLAATERRVTFAGDVPIRNVAGFWPGKSPELAHEVLIVSAHYDHVGTTNGEVFNGADDNASGTTGLLGIAEALVAYGPLERSVLLLWVSGEEKGLWGSDAWTRAPQLPDGCVPVADLNIDMIGRTRTNELYITPTNDHPSFNAVAQAAYDLAPSEGFPELLSQDPDWRRSDHFNFDQNLEIPVVFLSAGEHPDYHQPTDTAEKIDFEKLARVTRLIVRVLDRVDTEPLERRGE